MEARPEQPICWAPLCVWQAQRSMSWLSICRCRPCRSRVDAPRNRGVARVRRPGLRHTLAFVHTSGPIERSSPRRVRGHRVPVGHDAVSGEWPKASHRGLSSRCRARTPWCRIAGSVQGFEDTEVLAKPRPERATPRAAGRMGATSDGPRARHWRLLPARSRSRRGPHRVRLEAPRGLPRRPCLRMGRCPLRLRVGATVRRRYGGDLGSDHRSPIGGPFRLGPASPSWLSAWLHQERAVDHAGRPLSTKFRNSACLVQISRTVLVRRPSV